MFRDQRALKMMKITVLSLMVLLVSFGCSQKNAVINLGVIELAPNSPKHVTIGGRDWVFTETLGADGKPIITAESKWKVTQADKSSPAVPAWAKVGGELTLTTEVGDGRPGHKVTQYFGDKLAEVTLKYNVN